MGQDQSRSRRAEKTRWERLRAAFGHGLGLEPDERKRWLEEEFPVGDPLRDELIELLQAHGEAGSFLETPALASDRSEDLPGRIGRYRIERLLGEGGMARVFLGVREDEPYLGPVAIKVVAGGALSSELARRLEQERRLVAQLEHPHIARLLDAGTDEGGQPYFVMEYVQGEPIDVAVQKLGLTGRSVVDLFTEICDAVAYAHRNLVVHRDLKPSNILLAQAEAGQPSTKLLDFGIAKLLTDQDRLADPGATRERWMTTSYASPEQVLEQPVTTASDVYSLGVLLFELLTGRKPYEADTSYEIQRAVVEQDAPAPSQVVSDRRLGKVLRGELDAIIGKALKKDSEQRYASAEQLGQDLRAFLQDRPISARPDSLGEVVRRFARRNRALATVLLAFLLSAVAGITAILWQSHETARQARLVSRTNAFLGSILSWPEPELAGSGMPFLDAIERVARDIDEEFGDEPKVAASLHSRIGQTLHRLGQSERARDHLEQSIRLLRSLDQPTELALSLHRLSELQYDQRQIDLALQSASEALRLHGHGSPGLDLASTHDLLGLIQLERGDHGQSFEHARLALALWEDAGPQGDAGRVLSWNNLGLIHRATGDVEGALQAVKKGLALARRCLPKDHLRASLLLHNLGHFQMGMGHLEEAHQSFEESLKIRQSRLDAEHVDVGIGLASLAEVLSSLNDLIAAKQRALEALHVFSRLHDRYPSEPRYATLKLDSQATLARVYRAARDYGNAAEVYNQLLEGYREALGPHHRYVRSTLRSLAGAQLDLALCSPAKQTLNEALRIDLLLGDEAATELSWTRDMLARAHLVCDEPEASVAWMEEALLFQGSDPETPRWRQGANWTLLAEAHLACGATAQAIEAAEQSHNILSEVFGSQPNSLMAHAKIVRMAARSEGEAFWVTDAYQEALEVLIERRGADHPAVTRARTRERP